MKTPQLYVIVLILTIERASTRQRAKSIENKTKFCQEKCFTQEVLVTRTHNPNQLTVYKPTNTLYFSYDRGNAEYQATSLNLDTKKMKLIKGIKDAYAITSDCVNGYVYFGGSNGLYRFKPHEKKLSKLAVSSLDIWWISVYNNTPCFIRFPSLRTYCYNSTSAAKISPLEELKEKTVHQVIFNKQKDIYYINNGGLYFVGKNRIHVPIFNNNPRILCMAMNNQGVIYVCNDEGIFELTDTITESKLKKVLALPGVLSITFDKNNDLIYTDSHRIYRLKHVKEDNYRYYSDEGSINLV